MNANACDYRRGLILDAILMPDATKHGAAVRNAGRKALDELLAELERVRPVVNAAVAVHKECPDGFDTGPGQDRVDAVFKQLRVAVEGLNVA